MLLKRLVAASKYYSYGKTSIRERVSISVARLLRCTAVIQQFLSGLYLEQGTALLPAPSCEPLCEPLREGEEEEEGERGLAWDSMLWGVPKKRTSHSRKRLRNRHKYLKPRLNFIPCPQCKQLKLLHVLCGNCLKETMRKTAEIRYAELELKLQQMADKVNSVTKP